MLFYVDQFVTLDTFSTRIKNVNQYKDKKIGFKLIFFKVLGLGRKRIFFISSICIFLISGTLRKGRELPHIYLTVCYYP